VTGVLVWLGVGVLGGASAIARFLVDVAVSERFSSRFPAGTFLVNLSGSAVLGVLTGLALHGDALLLAGTAVIGSYTTFSTWMYDTHRLYEDGEWLLLAANVVLSLVLGLGAVALGRLIASS
jgi:CrcB protein